MTDDKLKELPSERMLFGSLDDPEIRKFWEIVDGDEICQAMIESETETKH